MHRFFQLILPFFEVPGVGAIVLRLINSLNTLLSSSPFLGLGGVDYLKFHASSGKTPLPVCPTTQPSGCRQPAREVVILSKDPVSKVASQYALQTPVKYSFIPVASYLPYPAARFAPPLEELKEKDFGQPLGKQKRNETRFLELEGKIQLQEHLSLFRDNNVSRNSNEVWNEPATRERKPQTGDMQRPEMSDEPPDVIGGRYVVEEVIHLGGMSELYLVRDNRSDRGERVVAKVGHTRQHEADEVRATFERERCFMKELTHPNLLPCKDFGEISLDREAQPMPYLIMPYVEGADLKTLLSRQWQGSGGLERLRSVKKIFNPLLSALECLHDEGLVHCDIKPDNILRDHNGHVFLIDLGNTTPIGKPATFRDKSYSAPETGTMRVVNETSDVYSLGVLLFELLTGLNPTRQEGSLKDEAFGAQKEKSAGSWLERGGAVLLEGWNRLRQIRDYGPDLAKIISKAIAPASIDRYPDVEVLREALDNLYTRYLSTPMTSYEAQAHRVIPI